jgi:hypothetical protein
MLVRVKRSGFFETYSQERHERVYHQEATFNRSIQCLGRALLLLRASIVEDRLRVLNVRVAQELVKVLVRDLCRQRKLALLKMLVDLLGRNRKLVQDPPLW